LIAEREVRLSGTYDHLLHPIDEALDDGTAVLFTFH
jgi:hypothetical protein